MTTSVFLNTIHESNRQAADGWVRSAPHRAQVMGLLNEVASASRSLGLLGPGQMNDIDLDGLLSAYATVWLVDIDVETVRAALARRGVLESDRCRVCGPVDLTGILDVLSASDQREGLSREVSAVRRRPHVDGAPFDVTVSLCVLTQLLASVWDSGLAGEVGARLALVVRDEHLLDLVTLTKRGGRIVLVTDVVSTTSAPELLRARSTELETQMANLVATRNFFTGTNPYRLAAVLEEDDRFRREVCDVKLSDPWLWATTPDRQHLTCALTARRV